ncbi:hypothetical protein BCR35DRAFT_305639 [Leucosporidium creatinivorum]|uniref:Oxidoreductase n=1 Tax=Leucosporidium creatinivorum TaxID=106004 RepID=A0A1Y2EZ57_9BASI|nr:hypothetical protein BCR35DRAFT_305639 [Leucosporidium creatinivorum]
MSSTNSKKSALVIGGSRGLGRSLVSLLHTRGYNVFTTVRTAPGAGEFEDGVKVIEGVDLGVEGASTEVLEEGLGGGSFELVVYSAGYFTTDTLDTLNWTEMQRMLNICALAPAFILGRLNALNALKEGVRVLLITTEGGSVTLRTSEEGGGNYGHHASKAAANMVGKLLSIDLAKKGVTVVNIHPGFMRTSMTRDIGYDQFWDEGGAVDPDEAAVSLLDFAEREVREGHGGQFWAPRGPRDIGEAERVLGKDLPTPLQLPY